MKFPITYFLLAALLASSCGAIKHHAGNSDKSKTSYHGLSENQWKQLSFNYVNATKEQALGNLELATTLYLNCLEMDPKHDASMYELARIYHKKGNRAQSLEYSRKATLIKPDNIWYQRLYANNLQEAGQFHDAIKVHERMIKLEPNDPEHYFELADAQIFAHQYEDAVHTYDKLEALSGPTEELASQKIKLFRQLKQSKKEEAEYKKLIRTFPGEGRYYGMLGQFYQMEGKNEEAFKVYQELLSVDPTNPYVHLSLYEYYRFQRNERKSFEELKLAFTQDQLEVEAKIKILHDDYTFAENDAPEYRSQVEELCKILTTVHPNDARVRAIYGDFLYRDKKLKEALTQFHFAVELDKSKFLIWNQLMVINLELKDYTALEKESKEVMELFPTQPAPYYYYGLASMQLKNYQAAAESLTEGINYVLDDRNLLSQFYTLRGDAFHQLQKHKESDQSYEKALQLSPGNPYLLNNYSYYLALRKERLEEAEKMSIQALRLEPNNASNMDTYGWVLYNMGKYSEAEKWVGKAIQEGASNNSEVLEHYGDILYQLGDKDKALMFWLDSRGKGNNSLLLEKKISDKKLYE